MNSFSLTFIFFLSLSTPSVAPSGKKYGKAETSKMLDLAAEHRPIGLDEWQIVANEFNRMFPNSSRDAANLRDHFKKLKNSRKPTGNVISNCQEWLLSYKSYNALNNRGPKLPHTCEKGEENLSRHGATTSCYRIL